MSEYICKEKLYKRIAELEELARDKYLNVNSDMQEKYKQQLVERTALKHLIADFETEEVEPVIHAKWIKQNGYTECSNCGYWYRSDEKEESDDRSIGCPNCGAKMDLKEW